MFEKKSVENIIESALRRKLENYNPGTGAHAFSY